LVNVPSLVKSIVAVVELDSCIVSVSLSSNIKAEA